MPLGTLQLVCPTEPTLLARTPDGLYIATNDCPEICDLITECTEVYIFYPCTPDFDLEKCTFNEDRLWVCPTQQFYDVDTGLTSPISVVAGGGILVDAGGTCYYTDGILVDKDDAIADGVLELADSGTTYEIHSALTCDSAECDPGPFYTCPCLCYCYGPTGELCCFGMKDSFDGRVTYSASTTTVCTATSVATADYTTTVGSWPVADCNDAGPGGTIGPCTTYSYERRTTGAATYNSDCTVEYDTEQRTIVNRAGGACAGSDSGSPTWTTFDPWGFNADGLGCLESVAPSDTTTIQGELDHCVQGFRVIITPDENNSCTHSGYTNVTTTWLYVGQTVDDVLTCTCQGTEVCTVTFTSDVTFATPLTTREARLCELCDDFLNP